MKYTQLINHTIQSKYPYLGIKNANTKNERIVFFISQSSGVLLKTEHSCDIFKYFTAFYEKDYQKYTGKIQIEN